MVGYRPSERLIFAMLFFLIGLRCKNGCNTILFEKRGGKFRGALKRLSIFFGLDRIGGPKNAENQNLAIINTDAEGQSRGFCDFWKNGVRTLCQASRRRGVPPELQKLRFLTKIVKKIEKSTESVFFTF